MKKIRIIQVGLGGVGKGVIRMLAKLEWVDLVGAVDVDPEIVGKDVGYIAGLEEDIGILVTNDAASIYDNTEVDVAIISTSNGTIESIYPEVLEPLKNGINVITPCMDFSDPYLYNAELSDKINEICLKHKATFLGIGSTQLVPRSLLAISETCRDIKKVSCFVHADITKFPLSSKMEEFGVMLPIADYEETIKLRPPKGRNALRKEPMLIANSLGLDYDNSVARYEPILQEDIVIGVSHIFQVLKGDRVVVEYVYKFIEDPENKYFHEYILEAIPNTKVHIDFSADRGLEGTIVPMVKSLKRVVLSDPGILSMLDLKPGFWTILKGLSLTDYFLNSLVRLMMGLPVLPAIASKNPSNLTIIVFDNEQYEAGGKLKKFTADLADLTEISKGAGIKNSYKVKSLNEFENAFDSAFDKEGPTVIVVKVSPGVALVDLPNIEMPENKHWFARYIEKTENIKIIKGAKIDSVKK